MSNFLVEAKAVTFQVGQQTLVNDINLAMADGEIITVIGPNGAGKSTLIRLLLGLIQPSSGQIVRRPKIRIGYMPQRLHIDSNFPITVGRFLRLANASKKAIQLALDEVGMGHLADSPLQYISGGELQRVLLARALLRDPDLLVLDEPVQGVDISGQTELYELITSLRNRHGCGVLMVSHDLHLVMAQTDHVICLNNHICCQGHPEHVSNDPAFRELFGQQEAQALAVYHHQHDHSHDPHGNVVCDHGAD
jgi:zinc transport system ATP-binding protein